MYKCVLHFQLYKGQGSRDLLDIYSDESAMGTPPQTTLKYITARRCGLVKGLSTDS